MLTYSVILQIDNWSFIPPESHRIWHLRTFCYKRLFFDKRSVCFWQHPHLSSRKMMGIKEFPYGPCFKCFKLAIGRETALASTVDNMLAKLDKQDACKWTTKLCRVWVSSPSYVLHSRKFCHRPIGLRWMLQHCREIRGTARQPDFSVISIILEAACLLSC